MHTLSGLKTVALGHRYLFFDELPSTNTYLKENESGLPHGTAVMASAQTAGKGRLGRSWQHKNGAGLAFSVLLKDIPVSDLPLLPLLTGLACVLAFDGHGICAGIKWSNDIVIEGKKLVGILCESIISAGNASAVIGIGVNLAQSAGDLERLDLVYATSLFLATGRLFEPEAIAADILNELEPLLTQCARGGFEAVREQYASRCVTVGKDIRIITGESEETGYALDIAPDGGLICDINGSTRTVYSGEASVRGIYGYV